MSETANPEYGVSEHYLGEKGKAYFAWQNGGALFAGQINARKFSHLVTPSDTVLDFGCGGGGLLSSLTCARKIGVEINPIALECANQLGIECYSTVDSVPDGLADVVLSDHALEHVPFPIGVLRLLRTKLKPGGILSICVPIDNWRCQRRYYASEPYHHLHTWTPLLLGHTLFESGFDVTEIYARTYRWPGTWTVAAYGRLPYWLFRSICYAYGTLTGNGREVLALAKVADRSDKVAERSQVEAVNTTKLLINA